jgi:hypothetical protein
MLSECDCCLNANSAIFKLYHGENKLIFIEIIFNVETISFINVLKRQQRLAWVVYGIGLGEFRSGPIHSTQLLKVRG